MPRPPSDIGPRLVQAARERFLFEGVDGASLRNIAKDAGTNIGMVYYYFKTKDDLFLAVIEEVYGTLLEDLRTILASPIPPDECIAHLYARVAAMSDDEFKTVRLILREALVSSARLGKIAQRFLEGHIPLVLDLLQRGGAQDRLRSDQHPVALMGALFTLGMMPQIARRQLIATGLPIVEQFPSAESVAKTMYELLLHGIAKRGS